MVVLRVADEDSVHVMIDQMQKVRTYLDATVETQG